MRDEQQKFDEVLDALERERQRFDEDLKRLIVAAAYLRPLLYPRRARRRCWVRRRRRRVT